MQVLSSLKTAKTRHPNCKVVRRHGVVYVICKENPRFKAASRGQKEKTLRCYKIYFHIAL
ncbi:50S ribosomal protein L36 [Avibacterium endocarditidis]|uniref:Large ribosomal subunit protein bL36 n=1 Tax=Avibacterium endocarditidis TaxID=380674 RepID=A0ABX4ZQA8_9PAST|nr:50S ribosomal protein L36 [Avibacterium endocarditidis]